MCRTFSLSVILTVIFTEIWTGYFAVKKVRKNDYEEDRNFYRTLKLGSRPRS